MSRISRIATAASADQVHDQSRSIAFCDITAIVSRERELELLSKSWDRLLEDMDSVHGEFKRLNLRLQNGTAIVIEDEEYPYIPRTTDRPPVPPERNGRSKHALVVDDVPVSQKLLEIRLRNMGFTCDVANDGQQAVDKAMANEYDLIFMDCDMPVLDGFEASLTIRRAEMSTGQHVPIIAMTAYDRPDDRERCLSAGMDEYVNKTVSSALLQEVVEWCLRRGDIHGSMPLPSSDLDEEELDIPLLKESYSLYELSEVLNSFVQGTNTVMRCLKMAIDEKEVRSIAHFAYSLKGPFATLGLIMTARLTATLTDSAEASDWIDVDDYYDCLADKCKRILQQVDDFNTRLEKS